MTTTVILPDFLAALGIPAAVLGTVERIADALAGSTKMVCETSLATASSRRCGCIRHHGVGSAAMNGALRRVRDWNKGLRR